MWWSIVRSMVCIPGNPHPFTWVIYLASLEIRSRVNTFSPTKTKSEKAGRRRKTQLRSHEFCLHKAADESVCQYFETITQNFRHPRPAVLLTCFVQTFSTFGYPPQNTKDPQLPTTKTVHHLDHRNTDNRREKQIKGRIQRREFYFVPFWKGRPG